MSIPSAVSRTLIVTLIVTLPLLGCDRREDAPAPASSSAAQPEHAPTNVVPGSHEDWCGEHQVPESLCTRCNADLIAAFQATGDWCPEHGLPESQCLICNPELKIVRPPLPASVKP
jgi:uncharacterized lipoprotein NlpE involved in copper resistance